LTVYTKLSKSASIFLRSNSKQTAVSGSGHSAAGDSTSSMAGSGLTEKTSQLLERRKEVSESSIASAGHQRHYSESESRSGVLLD